LVYLGESYTGFRTAKGPYFGKISGSKTQSARIFKKKFIGIKGVVNVPNGTFTFYKFVFKEPEVCLSFSPRKNSGKKK
jgi:hypothetical protein